MRAFFKGIGFVLNLLLWVVGIVVGLSLLALLAATILGIAVPIQLSLGDEAANATVPDTVIAQHNKVAICAEGGIAYRIIENHFETYLVAHKLCTSIDSKGTKFQLEFTPNKELPGLLGDAADFLLGDRTFTLTRELPIAGNAWELTMPWTNERITLGEGDFAVYRLVDLSGPTGDRTVRVLNHATFLRLKPGTRLTGVRSDPTIHSKNDELMPLSRKPPMLVAFEIVGEEVHTGQTEGEQLRIILSDD